MNFENTLLSVSYNLFHKKIDQHIVLKDIINIISSDKKLHSQISRIRQEINLKQQRNLKSHLPLFFPAIKLPVYKKIACNESISSTGLIHFDIDIYDTKKIDKLFYLLTEQIPYLVYAFRSPRNGLKFAIASDFAEHSKQTISLHYARIYRAVKVFLQNKIPELNFDDSNERISQSCFFSSDPELYVNFTPEIFPAPEFTQQQQQAQFSNSYVKPVQTNFSNQEKDKILEALSYIPDNMHYYDRFKINLAIISVFGADARTILLNHWQHENTQKLDEDVNTQISYALRNPILITAGTLYYYAKQYGFSF